MMVVTAELSAPHRGEDSVSKTSASVDRVNIEINLLSVLRNFTFNKK